MVTLPAGENHSASIGDQHSSPWEEQLVLHDATMVCGKVPQERDRKEVRIRGRVHESSEMEKVDMQVEFPSVGNIYYAVTRADMLKGPVSSIVRFTLSFALSFMV
jgi:hypothetical protein